MTLVDAEKLIRSLQIVPTSRYRSNESISVDRPTVEHRMVWQTWEESTAGADPYSWSEEYYRIAMPLDWVAPLLVRASDEGRSEGVIPARYWSYVVYVNTYTGDGGTKKQAPKFDEESWSHDLVLALLTFTRTTFAIEIRHAANFR